LCIQPLVSCPEQIRLAAKFDEADRAWIAGRDPNAFDLRDEGVSQARLDALADRNVAATQLYEYSIGCSICRKFRQRPGPL
jgi:hypothetical protein